MNAVRLCKKSSKEEAIIVQEKQMFAHRVKEQNEKAKSIFSLMGGWERYTLKCLFCHKSTRRSEKRGRETSIPKERQR